MPTKSDKYPKDSSDPNIVSETTIQPSTIENIDFAMFEYIDEQLNLFTDTNKGFKKTPVTWISSERAHQVKNKRELRDSNGSLILPIITVERTDITKDPARKGIFQANIPPINDYRGGSITINKRINQDKTANFANADALRRMNVNDASGGSRHDRRGQINFPNPEQNKIVYQTMSIPLPVYIDVEYKITLRTEYQQQMNQLVTPFITKTGAINSFLLKKNEHRYEAFIQESFSQDNNVSSLDEAERMYQTSVTIKVLGYLIGEDKNQEKPKVVIRENAVQIRMPRERVITADQVPTIDKRGFYKE